MEEPMKEGNAFPLPLEPAMFWNQGTVLARCLGLLLESGPRKRGLSISLGEGLLK